MASSYSDCFSLVSAVVVLLHLLIAPASAYTKYIDKVCKMQIIDNKYKPFCLKTLSDYPPAVSATGLLPLAKVMIGGLVIPHAQKSAIFADGAAKRVRTLKTQFKECHDAYVTIVDLLTKAIRELKVPSNIALNDAMICMEPVTRVQNLVGENKDKDSKSLIDMTSHMAKLLELAAGATEAVVRYE